MDMRTDETPADMVAVCDLCKQDGPEKALDNISFVAPRGLFTVLLGPAGAGKTTILRLLAGLETASSGTILMEGSNIAGVEPKDRDIAMIFDNLALYPHMTGFQNIASPLVSRKIPKDEITRRVKDIAAELRILHILDRLPGTMSGGERQRIALGRALVRSPRIFLLDEPLSSLDAPLRFELRSALKYLQRERGHTFLMATPDFNEAMAVADIIIMLRAGKVIQIAPPQEIYDHPADVQAALFVGSPQINILPAEHTNGVIRCLGMSLPVPRHLAAAMNSPAGMPDRTFWLGLRPENIELNRTLPAGEETSLFLNGHVVDLETLGLKRVITLRREETLINVLVDTVRYADIAVGESLYLRPVNIPRLLAFDGESRKNLVPAGETGIRP